MKRRKFVEYGVGGTALYSLNSPLHAMFRGQTQSEKLNPGTLLKTRICDLFNIEFPIIQAGMGNVAGSELVAAVSNAGGLGILSATMVTPEHLREEIKKIRDRTDRPFGVNLILQQDLFPPRKFDINEVQLKDVQRTLNKFRKELAIEESQMSPPPAVPPLIQQAFEVILEDRVPVFSIGLGNPSKEMVSACHRQGIKVMAMVCTLEDALEVTKSGVDVIVAQGSEAGGHRSTWVKKRSPQCASIGVLALVPQIIEKVQVPVIAAGGIINGKGLTAALGLGAEGVLIGTRFLATKESIAPDFYKRKVMESSSDATLVTDVFTGMYARVLRNDFTEQYEASGTPVLPPGIQFMVTNDIVQASEKQQKSSYYNLYAGQGIDGINEILSVEEVMRQLVDESLEAIQGLTTIR